MDMMIVDHFRTILKLAAEVKSAWEAKQAKQDKPAKLTTTKLAQEIINFSAISWLPNANTFSFTLALAKDLKEGVLNYLETWREVNYYTPFSFFIITFFCSGRSFRSFES